MTGLMHYDDLAKVGHERHATLLREAQQWRLARLAHARASAKGPPGGAWRWIRHPGRGPVGAYPPRRRAPFGA